MFYHILISTDEYESLYETDKKDDKYIIDYIIIPYLKKEPFVFNGYPINPFKVKRIKISQTENDSEYYYQKEKDYMEITRNFYPIDRGYCVTEMSKYSKDITAKVIKEAKERIGPEMPPPLPDPNCIFLAYSYRKRDSEFAEGFKRLLISRGFHVIDGQANQLGSISKAILDEIAQCTTFIAILTKRDKKTNNKYTTSSWLLDEKGAALALKKQMAIMIEEKVDESDIGGLHGDIQRFNFTRNNFLNVAVTLIGILEKNKLAGKSASGKEELEA